MRYLISTLNFLYKVNLVKFLPYLVVIWYNHHWYLINVIMLMEGWFYFVLYRMYTHLKCLENRNQ